MVPETWVPWPSRSTGSLSSQMKSRGDTKRAGRRAPAPPQRARPPRRAAGRSGRRASSRKAKRELIAERSPSLKATPVSSTATMTSGPEPGWISQARSMSMRRKVPLIRVQRIVRPVHRVVQIARLRVLDVAARRPAPRPPPPDRRPSAMVDQSKSANDGRSADPRRTTCAIVLLTAAPVGAVLELHDHRTGRVELANGATGGRVGRPRRARVDARDRARRPDRRSPRSMAGSPDVA